MKVGVVGLWHLGVVLSAGLTKNGYDVIAFDPDPKIIEKLDSGQIPVEEPGVADLLNEAQAMGKIVFSSDPKDLFNCEIIWIAYDTPVDEFDIGNHIYVLNEIKNICKWFSQDATIIISSQLPVGSSKEIREILNLHNSSNEIDIAVNPENLRLGKALDSLLNADRIIVGIENPKPSRVLVNLFNSFGVNVIYMKIESAEMLKHALNTFLATSVTFMCEISEICQQVGADAREVEIGLKTDSRIGSKAYLSPGLGFAGGTLARDVNYLSNFINRKDKRSILQVLMESNIYNNNWVLRKIFANYKSLENIRIVFMGLTYTTGTNTLRRSAMFEMALYLSSLGATIFFFEDESVVLPISSTHNLNRIKDSFEDDIENCILIVTKNMLWIQDPIASIKVLRKASLILDPYGYLLQNENFDHFKTSYLTVGRSNDY